MNTLLAHIVVDTTKLLAYIVFVDIEFDIAKNEANRARHGVDLEMAFLLFENFHSVLTDDRFDYGEIRKIAYGYIFDREYVCVFTERKNARRIVSLRKANRREINDHY